MISADLLTARRKAEDAVSDMPEGPLKLKAFEVILSSLLTGASVPLTAAAPNGGAGERRNATPSSLAGRVNVLAEEGFFSGPRSLAEIQAGLSERGWHYPQNSLSTPLVRLVRQRQLRRLQVPEGRKRVWKYSLP